MNLSSLSTGRRFSLLREALGLNQPALADFLHCTRERISMIENEKSSLDIGELDLLHSAGVSRTYLTKDSDEFLRDGFTVSDVCVNIIQKNAI